MFELFDVYDYVIVGGGIVGFMVVDCLIEDEDIIVFVFEFGFFFVVGNIFLVVGGNMVLFCLVFILVF